MTAELGHMYAYNYVKRCWTLFAVSKITKKRIFLAVAEGAQQCSLDRAKVEAEGSAWLYRGGAQVRLFYSAAGKAAVEAKWARTRAEIRRVADLLEHGDPLGLGVKFTLKSCAILPDQPGEEISRQIVLRCGRRKRAADRIGRYRL
jgi:hypothetical protein